MSAPASEAIVTSFVVLKSGMSVPLAALQLAWSLERRGATFSVEGDDLVMESPRGLLTDEDRRAIRRWREHLKAIATDRTPDLVA